MVGVDDGNGNSTGGDNGFATAGLRGPEPGPKSDRFQSAAGACVKGRGGTTNVGSPGVGADGVDIVGADDEIEDAVVVDEVSSGSSSAAAGGNCDGAAAGDVVIICVFCSAGKSRSTFEICGSEAALNGFFLINVSFRFVVTTSKCLRSNAFK